MLIYIAGNSLLASREAFIIEHGCNRLFSYFHHNDEGMAHMDFEAWRTYIDEQEPA